MVPQLVVDATDETEIEQCDRLIGEDEDICRVGIGVEETMLEDHPQVDPGASLGDRLQVGTFGSQSVDLVDFGPFDPLHRQDFGCAEI